MHDSDSFSTGVPPWSTAPFAFVQLDVFTNRPLEGNQLAVFTDARGLSDDEMQKLARETNLSETTFIFPRDPEIEQREGHKVRIFTVNEELPFAGHPTLGYCLVSASAVADIRDRTRPEGGQGPGVVSSIARSTCSARCARWIRPVRPQLIPTPRWPKSWAFPSRNWTRICRSRSVSTGMWFTIVPFRSLATLQNLKVSWHQMESYLRGLGDNSFFYLVCRETVNPERHACTLA